jgi:hypothetical protein
MFPRSSVARAVDALGLEDEIRLIDVHLASVDPENEVRAGFDRRQRPLARIGAEVQNALAA